MGLSPPPPLRPLLVALALTPALAGCGGGTTGAPLAAATTSRATAPAPTPVAPAAGSTRAAPQPAAAAPPAASRASARRSAHARTTTQPAPRPASPASATPATRPLRPLAPKPRTTSVVETADLTLTRRPSPAHYFQAGTVTGTYAGTMTAEARITSQGVLVSFTATLPGGTIAGHAVAIAIINGSATPGLRGTAEITAGSGRFAGIHGSGLRVTGSAKPDGSYAHVRLAGTVTL